MRFLRRSYLFAALVLLFLIGSGEVARLSAAVSELPPLTAVKNEELRCVLEITWHRIRHALLLRQALQQDFFSKQRHPLLDEAQRVREESLAVMREVQNLYSRYPEAYVFEEHPNPTAYQFGYGWTAATLHFWEREERMVRYDFWWPFFRNIFDLWRILI